MRTRIKICGITRHEDAEVAITAGADALGFVFYPGSPRYVEPKQAREIVRPLAPFVTSVGLFLDAEAGWVREVAEHVGLDMLQFHGQESPATCRAAGMPFLKAVGMGGQGDPRGYAALYVEASGILLDSHAQGKAGGTGQTFDWSAIDADAWPVPIVLAGGLTPENVYEALRAVHPYAVDVSSGVESAPGIKDPAKIMRFVEEVRRGDAQ